MRPCVRALRSRTLRLWALLLGLAAVSVTLTDLLSQRQHRHWPEGAPVALPPLRFARPPPLEVMVESWAAERRVEEPLDSLLEEQLLSVLSSAGDRRSFPKNKRSYQLLRSQRKEPRASAPLIRAAQAMEQSAPRHRPPPDSRAPGCLEGQYSESLPSVSVLICFRDEPLSSLLRTVHSVLDTVPAQHLRELLLLGDYSQDEEQRGLSQYVSSLKGVRLVRTPRRLGPGRCRNLGASRASGDVLVMMGPRVECHRGWLEPLLERLAQDRTLVVSPVLDVVDPQLQHYSASSWPLRGVWDWSLEFHWDHPPAVVGQKQEEKDILPLKSPALGGEVLAVDRLFFNRLGAYDPVAVAWGPQQVELSLRVWFCGGSIEVVPCSRVNLVGGPSAAYDPPDPEQLQRDKVRVAEAWMGQYKRQFYRRDTLAHFIRQAGAPNTTERVRLQKALGCKDMSWYLSSVAPELYVPQDQPGLSGELYNVGIGSCMDYPRGAAPAQGRDVVMVSCSGTGAQHCELNSVGELRWGPGADLCLEGLTDHVVLSVCSRDRAPPDSQHWSYRKMTGQMVHSGSQLCLQAEEAPVGDKAGEDVKDSSGAQAGVAPVGAQGGLGRVVLRPCSPLPTQQWSFEELVDPPDS